MQGPSPNQGPSQAPAGSNNNEEVNKTNACDKLVIKERSGNKLVIEYNNRTYTFELVDGGIRYVEGQMRVGMRSAKGLLKDIGLGKVARCIIGIINDMRASQSTMKKPEEWVVDRYVLPNDMGTIEVSVSGAGSLIVRYRNGGNESIINIAPGMEQQLASWLLSTLPSTVTMGPDGQKVAEWVRNAIERARKSIIPTREGGYVVTESSDFVTVKGSVITDDNQHMITVIPVGVRAGSKPAIATLTIMSRADGTLESMEFVLGEALVEVNGKKYGSRYTEGLVINNDLLNNLPGLDIINPIREALEPLVGKSQRIDWFGLYNTVCNILDAYVEFMRHDRVLACLWAIAQVYSDILDRFPEVVVYGEHSSGKRQFSFFVRTVSIMAIDVSSPTLASLFTLGGRFHMTMIIDESELSKELVYLLNVGFERGHEISRIVMMNDGRRMKIGFDPYGPKLVIRRLGEELPLDTLSRAIVLHAIRFVGSRTFPTTVIPELRREANKVLIMAKVFGWGEFLSEYNRAREVLSRYGVNGRVIDTYAPLVAVATLIAKARPNDPSAREPLETVIYTIVSTEEASKASRQVEEAILLLLEYTNLGKFNTKEEEDKRYIIIPPKRRLEEEFGEANLKVSPNRIYELYHVLDTVPFAIRRRGNEGYYYLVDPVGLFEFIFRYHIPYEAVLTQSGKEYLKDIAGVDIDAIYRRIASTMLVESDENVEKVISELLGTQSQQAEASQGQSQQTQTGSNQQAQASSSQAETTSSGSGSQTELTNQQVVTNTPTPSQSQQSQQPESQPPSGGGANAKEPSRQQSQPGSTSGSGAESQSTSAQPASGDLPPDVAHVCDLECLDRTGGPTILNYEEYQKCLSECKERVRARGLLCMSTCEWWYRADAARKTECIRKCLYCDDFDPAAMACRGGGS